MVDNKLVTTFDNIPDAPVSSFKLDIKGGEKGILVVSGADLCKGTQIADQEIDGQNGETADAKVIDVHAVLVWRGRLQPLGQDAERHGRRRRRRQGRGVGLGAVGGLTDHRLGDHGHAEAQAGRVAALGAGPWPNVRVRVKVSFTPAGAKKAKVVRKTITIHGAAKKAKR